MSSPKDQVFTIGQALHENSSWREAVHHPLNAPPMAYILDGEAYRADLIMWVNAFEEQFKKHPEFVTHLSSKAVEEQEEFMESLMDYRDAKIAQADKHDLNAKWLHVLDEAADAFNTIVAYYLNVNECCPKMMPEVVLFEALEDEVDFIADLIENVTEEQLASMARAVLSYSTAKLRITELRPHAQQVS